MKDFDETIKSYVERGTVGREICEAIALLIRENEATLFSKNGYLDFDVFVEMVKSQKKDLSIMARCFRFSICL